MTKKRKTPSGAPDTEFQLWDFDEDLDSVDTLEKLNKKIKGPPVDALLVLLYFDNRVKHCFHALNAEQTAKLTSRLGLSLSRKSDGFDRRRYENAMSAGLYPELNSDQGSRSSTPPARLLENKDRLPLRNHMLHVKSTREDNSYLWELQMGKCPIYLINWYRVKPQYRTPRIVQAKILVSYIKKFRRETGGAKSPIPPLNLRQALIPEEYVALALRYDPENRINVDFEAWDKALKAERDTIFQEGYVEAEDSEE